MSQGVGDVCWHDRVPLLVMGVAVAVKRHALRGTREAQSVHEAGKSFGRTEEEIFLGNVSCALAPHGVLLVREGQAVFTGHP